MITGKKFVIYDPDSFSMVILPYLKAKRNSVSEWKLTRVASFYTKGRTCTFYGDVAKFNESCNILQDKEWVEYDEDMEILTMRSPIVKHSDTPCIVDIWAVLSENLMKMVFVIPRRELDTTCPLLGHKLFGSIIEVFLEGQAQSE